MSLRRHTDAEFHNYLANHSDIKPTLGYNEGPTDFTPLLAHPESYILLSDGKGFGVILEWSAPGVWQSHTMALPEARGKQSIEATKLMVAWCREQGFRLIWGMTPKAHRPARIFNRKVGFKAEGEGTDANGVPVINYVMEL